MGLMGALGSVAIFGPSGDRPAGLGIAVQVDHLSVSCARFGLGRIPVSGYRLFATKHPCFEDEGRSGAPLVIQSQPDRRNQIAGFQNGVVDHFDVPIL